MEGFEYKMIHAINFKCISCQKKYATEDGMKKHIKFTHAVQTPTSVHYESFVGVRKVKVPTNQGTTTSTSKPPNTVHQVTNGSISSEGLAYNCGMCSKVFKSFGGVKHHLQSFHGVTSTITTELYSYSFLSAPNRSSAPSGQSSTFVPPLLKNMKTDKIGPSSAPTTHEPKMPQQSPTGSDNKEQKTADPKAKKKDKNPKGGVKVKRKSNVGFSTTLANIFSSGKLKMEKFSLWGEKLNGNKSHHSEIPDQPSDSVMPQPSSSVDSQPSRNIQPSDSVKIQSSDSVIIQSSDFVIKNPEAVTPQPQPRDILSPQPENHTQTEETEEHTQTEEHKQTEETEEQTQTEETQIVMFEDLDKMFDKMFEDQTVLEISQGQGETGKKDRNKQSKRKRSCDQPDCEPCSVPTDCLTCRYCENKKLKQRCILRQCHNLNSRLRRKDTHKEQLNLETNSNLEPFAILDIFGQDDLGDGDHGVEEDNESEISPIIEDIISAAWADIMKSKNRTEVNTITPRPKQYKCINCGQLFAQYASAVKHCAAKSPDKGAVCPLCGKQVLLKRNLKRHIQNVHNSVKENAQNKPKEILVIKCDECGKVYSSKNKLVEHMQKKHGAARKEGPMIRCSECEFSHPSESRVKAHFTIEHTAGLTLECQLCDARFRSKSGLQKHVYRVHKSQPRSNQITSSNPENVVATKSLPQPVHPVLPQLSPEHLSHLPAVLSRASGQIQLPVVIARQSHFHVGISRQNHLQVGISGQNQQLGMWDQDAMQVGSPGQQLTYQVPRQNAMPGHIPWFTPEVANMVVGQNLSAQSQGQNLPAKILQSGPFNEFLVNNSVMQVNNVPTFYSSANCFPPNQSQDMVDYHSPSIITDSGSTYQTL